MMEPILKINNLYVNYHSYWYIYKVLDNVSIQLTKGEKIGVIGESGAGKTTLLKSILKNTPQDRIINGSIIYKGSIDLLKISETEINKIRRSEIGMIF